MTTSRTEISARGTQLPVTPNSRIAISARKDPIMKISPWAKLIMPMMP